MPAVCLQAGTAEDAGDLLPGLCRFAQQWLNDVAAARFTELRAPGGSLDAWYRHHKVVVHLKVGGNHESPTISFPRRCDRLDKLSS